MGLKGICKNAGMWLFKHKSDILMGVGFIAIAGGTVAACNASRKLDKVLDETQAKIDDAMAEGGGVESERAVRKAKIDCAFTLTKMYAPATLLIGGGFVAIGVAHADDKSRIRDLGMALNDSVATLAFYRGNARRRFGDDVDKELLYGYSEKEITHEAYTDEEGISHPERKETAKVAGESAPIIFTFGPDNPNWQGSVDLNLKFLTMVEQMCNKEFVDNGGKITNDVIMTYLGLKKDVGTIHKMTGKVLDGPVDPMVLKNTEPGSGYIDLGIVTAYKDGEELRSNGGDVVYYLCPNTQEFILDKWDKKRKHG